MRRQALQFLKANIWILLGLFLSESLLKAFLLQPAEAIFKSIPFLLEFMKLLISAIAKTAFFGTIIYILSIWQQRRLTVKESFRYLKDFKFIKTIFPVMFILSSQTIVVFIVTTLLSVILALISPSLAVSLANPIYLISLGVTFWLVSRLALAPILLITGSARTITASLLQSFQIMKGRVISYIWYLFTIYLPLIFTTALATSLMPVFFMIPVVGSILGIVLIPLVLALPLGYYQLAQIGYLLNIVNEAQQWEEATQSVDEVDVSQETSEM